MIKPLFFIPFIFISGAVLAKTDSPVFSHKSPSLNLYLPEDISTNKRCMADFCLQIKPTEQSVNTSRRQAMSGQVDKSYRLPLTDPHFSKFNSDSGGGGSVGFEWRLY